MIELIEGLPDGVVGFEAVGNLTLEDYDNVVTPVVEHRTTQPPTLRTRPSSICAPTQ